MKIHPDARKLEYTNELGPMSADFDDPRLEPMQNNRKKWPGHVITQLRHDSADAIREMTRDKTDDEPPWSDVFDHRLGDHIDDVIGTIALHHAGPVIPRQGHVNIFDPNIIEVIPEDFGPCNYKEKVERKSKSSAAPTEGQKVMKNKKKGLVILEQVSGKKWMEQVHKVPGNASIIDGAAFRYCLLPAWMQPSSCKNAVSVHIDPIDMFGKFAYLGSSSVGAFYFHRHKDGRCHHYRGRARHSVAYFPLEQVNHHKQKVGFGSLGDASHGCEQLTKTKFPIPYSSM